jgi:hypothetical protein
MLYLWPADRFTDSGTRVETQGWMKQPANDRRHAARASYGRSTGLLHLIVDAAIPLFNLRSMRAKDYYGTLSTATILYLAYSTPILWAATYSGELNQAFTTSRLSQR